MSLSKFQELVLDREAWRAAIRDRKESDTTERLNQTELKSSEDPLGCVKQRWWDKIDFRQVRLSVLWK